MTLYSKFIALLAVIGTTLATMVVMVWLYNQAEGELQQALQARYDSYLLADELRQSSDDLTRLARTYTVTGDPAYEQQYFDILDIRNGKKPRPQEYYRIYWDFVAATGAPPRQSGATAPLLDLMKQAKFTDSEFEKLDQAKKNSDGLVGLEVQAMNLVKGIYPDSAGEYTIKGLPDLQRAAQLLHSKEYHKFKADIMTPVDEFYVLLDERTSSAINAAQEKVRFLALLTAICVIAVVIMFGASVWMILGRVMQPIKTLRSNMIAIANGNLNFAIEGEERSDEIGEMARTLTGFRESKAEEARLAERELTEKAQRELRGQRIEASCHSFNTKMAGVLESIVGLIGGMHSTALSMSSEARHAAHEAASVATSSERATTSGNAVAAAAEQLTSSISEIGRQMMRSTEVTSQAMLEAENTSGQIKSLSSAAQKVGAVVQMITDIANQTNLLALNATIEAARAGDAGKGFAVVASEVKGLANQTARATDDISQQIREIQQETDKAVEAIVTISRTVDEINQITSTVAAAVEEQGAATQEIARGIEMAANDTQSVTVSIGNVSKTTDTTAQAVEELLSSTSSLAEQLNQLRSGVEDFMTEVRSA